MPCAKSSFWLIMNTTSLSLHDGIRRDKIVRMNEMAVGAERLNDVELVEGRQATGRCRGCLLASVIILVLRRC